VNFLRHIPVELLTVSEFKNKICKSAFPWMECIWH
jgi:hypothetical protein